MKIWNFWKGRCLISTWKNPYLIWFTLILFYHWLSDEEQLKTTAKVFPLLKQNELFLLSIAIEQARNVDLMLPYCSREMQQRIQNVVPYRPNQCYVELFTRSGSEIVWFGAEVIATKYSPDHSHLEWEIASFERNEDLRKVYYEKENKIKFPSNVDRPACEKITILFIVLSTPWLRKS